MSSGEKEFYSTIYALSGIAAEFTELYESDFAAINGSIYVPPEEGEFRRINLSRTIQLLKNAVLGYKVSHINTGTILRLPCGLISTNDALNGRPLVIWNNGLSSLEIQNNLGVILNTLQVGQRCILFHTENNNWLVLFNAKDIKFDNSTNGFSSTNTQDAIEEVKNRVKSGIVLAGSFSGNPKQATVTFTTPFPDNNYSVVIDGIDKRSWSYELKTASGFIIDANANQNLTSDVSWIATRNNT